MNFLLKKGAKSNLVLRAFPLKRKSPGDEVEPNHGSKDGQADGRKIIVARLLGQRFLEKI